MQQQICYSLLQEIKQKVRLAVSYLSDLEKSAD